MNPVSRLLTGNHGHNRRRSGKEHLNAIVQCMHYRKADWRSIRERQVNFENLRSLITPNRSNSEPTHHRSASRCVYPLHWWILMWPQRWRMLYTYNYTIPKRRERQTIEISWRRVDFETPQWSLLERYLSLCQNLKINRTTCCSRHCSCCGCTSRWSTGDGSLGRWNIRNCQSNERHDVEIRTDFSVEKQTYSLR